MPARALSEEARGAVLAELHGERFVDCSPAQVWATLLDERLYLASQRAMYRLLATQHGGVRERRDQLAHPPFIGTVLAAGDWWFELFAASEARGWEAFARRKDRCGRGSAQRRRSAKALSRERAGGRACRRCWKGEDRAWPCEARDGSNASNLREGLAVG